MQYFCQEVPQDQEKKLQIDYIPEEAEQDAVQDVQELQILPCAEQDQEGK